MIIRDRYKEGDFLEIEIRDAEDNVNRRRFILNKAHEPEVVSSYGHLPRPRKSITISLKGENHQKSLIVDWRVWNEVLSYYAERDLVLCALKTGDISDDHIYWAMLSKSGATNHNLITKACDLGAPPTESLDICLSGKPGRYTFSVHEARDVMGGEYYVVSLSQSVYGHEFTEIVIKDESANHMLSGNEDVCRVSRNESMHYCVLRGLGVIEEAHRDEAYGECMSRLKNGARIGEVLDRARVSRDVKSLVERNLLSIKARSSGCCSDQDGLSL